MRWDVLTIAGLVIGVIGLGATFVLQARNEQLARVEACLAAERAVTLAMADVGVADEVMRKAAEETERARQADAELRRTLSQARSYAEAQEVEALASRVRQQFKDAIEDAGDRFEDFHPQGLTGDEWVEILGQNGYPRALADRQAIARTLLAAGFDESAAGFLVLSPATLEDTLTILDMLGDLSASMAVKRDDAYRPEFQGNPNLSLVITQLQGEVTAQSTRLTEAKAQEEDALRSLGRAQRAVSDRTEEYEALACA